MTLLAVNLTIPVIAGIHTERDLARADDGQRYFGRRTQISSRVPAGSSKNSAG